MKNYSKLIKTLVLAAMLFASQYAIAQQYTGMSGLIHTPSAEMDSAGVARIGAHFLNKHFMPNHKYWYCDGKKYNTGDFYISITPFSWVELGFTMTLFKHKANPERPNDKDGYNSKDRYFSIKFQPLKEGKWYPAVAIGANDFLSSGSIFANPFDKQDDNSVNSFWRNYYIALTKHLDLNMHQLGATVAYRYYTGVYNHCWQGVTAGITYRPTFARNFRAIVEWTGCDVNFGIDCVLWRHLMIQASLQNGKWPSAGLAYVVDLF